ncbi:hypothetical protein HAX54_043682 [Datura stramonium]|uniref:Serpin domain-containing protein n=1 Tax=Datura stramonium TaxID=4076 RepID=A0ABS8SNS0_DATST|nr:hypothetical protein [Datura stramonium]
MTAAGARGDTLNQMLQFLGVSDIDDLNSKFLNMTSVLGSNINGGPDLSFLNGIWVAHTHQIRDSFKELADTVYKAVPKVVDLKLKVESLDAFYIPKFKFSYTAMTQVVRTMMEMGLTLPFDRKCRAITEIVEPHRPFFVNGIIQKTFIEVNEKGTEAAAVTVLSDDNMGFSMYDLPRFEADHPFMFMVREEVSRLVLFTGPVLNPSTDHVSDNEYRSSSDSDN